MLPSKPEGDSRAPEFIANCQVEFISPVRGQRIVLRLFHFVQALVNELKLVGRKAGEAVVDPSELTQHLQLHL